MATNLFRTDTDELPYQVKEGLLSRGELAFYRALRKAISRPLFGRPRYGIAIKTRLVDIIDCPRQFWFSSYGAKVKQKHIDFLLYDWKTTAIVLAIELDDKSHRRKDRRERDDFVDQALATGGVALKRFQARRHYEPHQIRADVDAVLNLARHRKS